MSDTSAAKAQTSAESAATEQNTNLWVEASADKVLERFPNEPLYTCAAGISPSGIVHFGNFRDVMTAYAVMRELQARGKKARLLFSWDNYDRLRKVPANVPESYKEHIGKALTAIPDPFGQEENYARHFEVPFEQSMRELGLELDYRYQTKEYTSGRYAERVAFALQNRDKINEILLRFMTDKANEEKGLDPEQFRRENAPITIYSRFTGKDATEFLSYDGGTLLTYRCKITKQEEQIDFKQTPIVKLPWKVDWPMRWGEERVHFEPGGKDHMVQGGSFDVSSCMAREVFNREPPVGQIYEFVGVQGTKGKMSGSKGDAISPAQLLEIYEPELLKWLYMRRAPRQSFNLAFDTEVYRQYDEFDREIAALHNNELSAAKQKILDFSGVKQNAPQPIAFKQAVALGQITQWQNDKVQELAEKTAVAFSSESIAARLPKAKNWLTSYNPEEIITLRTAPASDYAASMDEQRKAHVRRLRAYVQGGFEAYAALEHEIYAIPKNPEMDDKDIKAAQRAFFKDVYQLLISRDAGPRLPTFLWVVDRALVAKLLDI